MTLNQNINALIKHTIKIRNNCELDSQRRYQTLRIIVQAGQGWAGLDCWLWPPGYACRSQYVRLGIGWRRSPPNSFTSTTNTRTSSPTALTPTITPPVRCKHCSQERGATAKTPNPPPTIKARIQRWGCCGRRRQVHRGAERPALRFWPPVVRWGDGGPACIISSNWTKNPLLSILPFRRNGPPIVEGKNGTTGHVPSAGVSWERDPLRAPALGVPVGWCPWAREIVGLAARRGCRSAVLHGIQASQQEARRDVMAIEIYRRRPMVLCFSLRKQVGFRSEPPVIAVLNIEFEIRTNY